MAAERAPVEKGRRKGAPLKKGGRLPDMAQWANDKTQPWHELKFNQFGSEKRPDQMFYCTKPD